MNRSFFNWVVGWDLLLYMYVTDALSLMLYLVNTWHGTLSLTHTHLFRVIHQIHTILTKLMKE